MGLSVVADWDQFPPPATGGGGGTGTVTNIATAAPLTGGPITTTGTIGITDFVASGVGHARGAVPDPGAVAGSTKFLCENGLWATPAGGGTPGGANTQIQFNDGGAFGGDADFTWDKANNILTLGTAARITTDTSNATQSNRFWFQNSVVNGNTNFGLMPNGAGTTGAYRAIDTSNPNGANRLGQMGQSSSVTFFDANVVGGGTQGTMELRIGGTAAIDIDTSKNVALHAGFQTPVVKKTGNYTIVETDCVVLADCTSGSLTLTLPAANVAGAGVTPWFRIKRIDSSANGVTISRAGADTIDGGTTYALGALQSVDLCSDGVSLWCAL